MGICSRMGCGKHHADRYSDRYGYLCPTCFNELVKHGVHMEVIEFMDTMRPSVNEEASRAYFDELFPLR